MCYYIYLIDNHSNVDALLPSCSACLKGSLRRHQDISKFPKADFSGPAARNEFCVVVRVDAVHTHHNTNFLRPPQGARDGKWEISRSPLQH